MSITITPADPHLLWTSGPGVLDVRPIEFVVRGLVLRGTVYTPGTEAPLPAVVLYHGWGNQRTEGFRTFVELARTLALTGFVVLTVDRAGQGESDGDFFDNTVSADVEDSLTVLDRIVALPGVDANNLHLVGMSMGSVIASVVAAETSHPIRSLTMWSPAGSFVDELRAGTIQGKRYDHVATTGYYDFYGLRLGPGFFADALEFDVYGRPSGFAGPVRILAGEDDTLVPARSVEIYRTVFPGPVEIDIAPAGDHGWSSVPLREYAISRTVDFVARCAPPTDVDAQ